MAQVRGSTFRGMRGGCKILLLAIVFLGMTGCTLSEGSDSGGPASSPVISDTAAGGPADPIPVSASDVVEAGGPIAPGFTVPDGAVLLGRAIPVGPDIPHGGWEAHLLVPSDPRPVMVDMVRQAEADGFDVRSYALARDLYASGSLCDDVDVDVDDSYRCSAVGVDSPSGDGRSISIGVVRQPSGPDAAVPAAWLRVSLWEEGDQATSTYPLPAIDRQGPEPSALPDGWVLPAVGDVVGDEFGGEFDGEAGSDLQAFQIVEGSRAIAPVLSTGDLGYTLLLAVTGDLDDVISRYLAQHDGKEGTAPAMTDDGSRVATYGGGGAGGPEFTLRSVEPPDGPPILLLQVNYG